MSTPKLSFLDSQLAAAQFAFYAVRSRLPTPRSERGAAMTEYGLLVSLVAIVVITIVVTLGDSIAGLFDVSLFSNAVDAGPSSSPGSSTGASSGGSGSSFGNGSGGGRPEGPGRPTRPGESTGETAVRP